MNTIVCMFWVLLLLWVPVWKIMMNEGKQIFWFENWLVIADLWLQTWCSLVLAWGSHGVHLVLWVTQLEDGLKFRTLALFPLYHISIVKTNFGESNYWNKLCLSNCKLCAKNWIKNQMPKSILWALYQILHRPTYNVHIWNAFFTQKKINKKN